MSMTELFISSTFALGTLSSPELSSETEESTELPIVVSSDPELVELMTEQNTLCAELVASNARIESQLEACISILLIFVIVGLLNYVYKFFKMFF